MSSREELSKLLGDLPEAKLRKVLEFALAIRNDDEDLSWRQFGREQFAHAYSDEEPEYTMQDVRKAANA
jgi:hypothetical protein